MIDPMKRHAIQVLKNAGLPVQEIAKLTATSRRSVTRIGSEEPEMRAPLVTNGTRSVGRPSKARVFARVVEKILGDNPDLPGVEVLRLAQEQGYRGGKSALYELIAELRPEKTKAPVVLFEGVAGEFSQHDFGSVRVKYDDGKTETVHFFASRLKWSRWNHVVLVPNERIEPLVRAFLAGIENFGGVPLVCVFDNPKTIVLRHVGPVIEWNETFSRVAVDYRFAAELCTPGRGNEKGAVENLVKWVKNSFFKVRRFHDREDLERQLAEWLKQVNTERPSRATKVTPLSRMEEERRRLRPLSYRPEEYPLRFPAMVGPTGMVQHEGVRYSMPAKAIGMSATLLVYPQRVRIIAGRFEAEHPRRPHIGAISYQPEHRAELLAAVSGERGQLYLKRQQLLELGAPAVDFLTELVHARPWTWKADVYKLHDALVSHGAPRLYQVLVEANARRLFGAEYVLDLLKEPA